jgi:hypothetical protein
MVEIHQEKELWLQCFNPCGVETVNQFIHSTCVSGECSRTMCLSKAAFLMASYILVNDSSLEMERDSLSMYLKLKRWGDDVILVNGEKEIVGRDNLNIILDEVVSKADNILREVELCVRLSLPITREYWEKCTSSQKDILTRIREKVLELESYSGDQYNAAIEERRMSSLLKRALDLGLGELGIVAKYAILFGLGNRVIQNSMSQIFNYPGDEGLEKKNS